MDSAEEHNRLYKQAVSILSPHLPLHGRPEAKAGYFLRRKLRKGVSLLERAIALNPHNWAAMWIAAMALRKAGDYERALSLFTRACEIQPNNADLPRETALTAVKMNRHAVALDYAQRAIRIKPDDPGLVANLAVAHLFNQQPAEAKRAADYALSVAPNDGITRRLVTVIDEVVAGKRPCPRSERELWPGAQDA